MCDSYEFVHVCDYNFFVFSFWKDKYSLAHQQLILDHWALPNGSTFLDPWLQTGTTYLPSLNQTWTLGKPYGIKLKCIWEQIGNLKGTWWDNVRNRWGQGRKTKEKGPPPPPHPKGNNRAFHECMLNLPLLAWNSCFQNYSSLFLAQANMAR